MNKVLLVVFFCFQSSQLKEITSKDVSEDKKVKELLADGYELDSISAPSLENDGLNMRLAVSVTLVKSAESNPVTKKATTKKPAPKKPATKKEEPKK